MVKESKIGLDLTLPSGKPFSPEMVNLDLIDNLDNIPRGYNMSGVRLEEVPRLQDHLILSYFIGAKYYAWLDRQGENPIRNLFPKSLGREKWGSTVDQLIRSNFCEACLTHDIHEVVTGDLIPSFKSAEYKEKENIAYKIFMDALGFDSKRAEGWAYHIKVVDIVASLYEIKKLLPRYPQVRRIYGQRLEKLKGLHDLETVHKIRPFVEEIGALVSDDYDEFLKDNS